MMPPTPDPSPRPKICFVSPYNYPLFNPRFKGLFGGWEVQIYNIARDVARRGNFEVSVIVADMGQPARHVCEGVELISWKGKAFWGISTADAPADETAAAVAAAAERGAAERGAAGTLAAAPAPLAPSPPAWRARLKSAYKRRVPWKLRFILHGLLDGVLAGAASLRSALSVVRRAVGFVAETPILPEMVEVFSQAGADLYIAPGVSEVSALTAWYCKTHARPYLMLAGSDRDFDPDMLANPEGRNVYGIPYSLLLYSIRSADRHIVQNPAQAELARRYGVSPILIPNPMNLERVYPRAHDARQVLWVGNTEERVKQPGLMLDLIRRLPEYEFVMIVTPMDAGIYARLLQTAARLPNVKMLSRIPFGEVEQYFAQARVFVSTSAFEGFPNTFLQAGKYGVPVVSLNVDPNGMLSKHGGGLVCAGDVGRLAEGVARVMSDDDLYAGLSASIARYVHQFHDPEKIIPQYEAVFRSALGRGDRDEG